MRLWFMHHVVHPAWRLLDSDVPPLGLCHEVILGHQLGNVVGQDHMSVLVLLICVFVRVGDLVLRHGVTLLDFQNLSTCIVNNIDVGICLFVNFTCNKMKVHPLQMRVGLLR